jgi:hypothetical protein
MFYNVQECKDIPFPLCIILHDLLGVFCNKNNKTAEIYEYQNVSRPHHTSLQDTDLSGQHYSSAMQEYWALEHHTFWDISNQLSPLKTTTPC